MCFIMKPATKKSPKDKVPFYDIIFSVLSGCACVYILLNYQQVLWKPLQWVSSIDKALAIVLFILVLEASRRCVGITFPIMGLLFLLYAYFGPVFPGMWGHRGFKIDFIFQSLYHATTGIWGTMVGISATMLAMFAIFGSMLSQTGGASTFIKIGQKATKKSVGGPGKVTIISSGLFGMISGSAMANVVATGTFTIPLMKKAGYTPEWAGAISAMGSTGGQLMPPIMGSAAFIMAQILGVSYLNIAIAAIVPALLYYFGAFVAVHYVSVKDKIYGEATEGKISVSELVVIFIPIAVFLYFLIKRYSVTNAAFYSTIAGICIYFIVKLYTSRNLKETAKESGNIVYQTALSGAASIIDMATLLAGAQITISLISMTGFGVKLSDLIISIGQNNLLLCLFLSMCVCILLGMGLPTTAAYVLAAAILVPALNRLGIELFVAHMFVIYFSILATITPPVCAAVYLSSGIAESNWVKTGFLAVLIALPGFIVPYTFAYNQALLLRGGMANIVISVVTAIAGVFFIGVSIAGYIKQKLKMVIRIILITSGTMLIIPNVFISTIALVICLIVFCYYKIFANKEKTFAN